MTRLEAAMQIEKEAGSEFADLTEGKFMIKRCPLNYGFMDENGSECCGENELLEKFCCFDDCWQKEVTEKEYIQIKEDYFNKISNKELNK